MSLRIRLARGGCKKRPFYRLVVAERTAPRDGKFLEKLGYCNPLLERSHPEYFVAKVERVKYWLSVGAQASERAQLLLSSIGVMDKPVLNERPKKSAPKKRAQERLKAEEEARQAASASSQEA